MTPVQIFLLGWQAYEKKKAVLRLLTPFADHANLEPPTDDEIKKILADYEPAEPRLPYDQAQMKEYPIG